MLNFIQWSEFENLVCKVAVILSRSPQLGNMNPSYQFVGGWVGGGLSLDSLKSSDTYARYNGNPSLVQMMACRLVGTKPLPIPVLEIVDCTIRKKHRRNLNRNWYRENIFNMSAKWTSFCLGLKVLTDWSIGLEYINMYHLVGAEIYWTNKQQIRRYTLTPGPWHIMVLYTLNANNLISMVSIYAEVTLCKMLIFNSLAPGRLNWIFRWATKLVIVGWNISCETDLRWISMDLTVSMEDNALVPSGNPFWISIVFCNGCHKN